MRSIFETVFPISLFVAGWICCYVQNKGSHNDN